MVFTHFKDTWLNSNVFSTPLSDKDILPKSSTGWSECRLPGRLLRVLVLSCVAQGHGSLRTECQTEIGAPA